MLNNMITEVKDVGPQTRASNFSCSVTNDSMYYLYTTYYVSCVVGKIQRFLPRKLSAGVCFICNVGDVNSPFEIF